MAGTLCYAQSFSHIQLGLEPGQNAWCLVLGPNEAQAFDVSLQENSVRDTAIGQKQICSYSERNKLHRVWAIAEGECGGHEMWCGQFLQAG